MTDKDFCDTFWGSHGCDLPLNHDPDEEHPVHQCAIASWDDEKEKMVTTEDDVCSQAQYLTKDSIRTRFAMAVGWTEWAEWPIGLFGLDDREDVR